MPQKSQVFDSYGARFFNNNDAGAPFALKEMVQGTAPLRYYGKLMGHAKRSMATVAENGGGDRFGGNAGEIYGGA